MQTIKVTRIETALYLVIALMATIGAVYIIHLITDKMYCDKIRYGLHLCAMGHDKSDDEDCRYINEAAAKSSCPIGGE